MISVEASSQQPESSWRLLLRLRWLLAGVAALTFALGQLAETLVLNRAPAMSQLAADVIGWGLLGGLAIWLSLTWASRQEQRYQAGLEQALQEQQHLNRQLQRANMQLALLGDVNRQIASSMSLDDLLDAALAFPQRLVQARAAALLLNNTAGPIITRIEGLAADELTRLQDAFVPSEVALTAVQLRQLAPRGPGLPGYAACLVLPLRDDNMLTGWIELYLEQPVKLAADEQVLLETIANEIAEAMVSARRRSREERAIYELEQAIAEERARIARDIHDGIAQSLAFRRMRVDLWLDWIEGDRQRLREELIGLKGALREQIAELRRAIFALRPVQFDELGFVGGLHRYIVEFASQQGWEVQVELGNLPAALPREAEATCFRIVQEALTNIAKHADANAVLVRIEPASRGLCVAVSDNGCGFMAGELPALASGRIGLRQMNERLEALGGQLTVQSAPGSGTEVRAWLPMRERTQTSETCSPG